jgi:hypothetical protein
MYNLNTVECTQISAGNQLTALVPITLGIMGAFGGWGLGNVIYSMGGGSTSDYLPLPLAFSATVIGGTIGACVGSMFIV